MRVKRVNTKDIVIGLLLWVAGLVVALGMLKSFKGKVNDLENAYNNSRKFIYKYFECFNSVEDESFFEAVKSITEKGYYKELKVEAELNGVNDSINSLVNDVEKVKLSTGYNKTYITIENFKTDYFENGNVELSQIKPESEVSNIMYLSSGTIVIKFEGASEIEYEFILTLDRQAKVNGMYSKVVR